MQARRLSPDEIHGQVSPAAFGDVGPWRILGEGSGRGIKWTHENTTTEALWQRIQSIGLNK